MASYPPPFLSTFLLSKEGEMIYQPILLVDIILRPDLPTGLQQYLGLCTHQVNSDYLPRLLDQNLDAIQSISEIGANTIPSVSLHIDDADDLIFTDFEMEFGFRGADMKIWLTFFDVATLHLASTKRLVFTGRCDAVTEVDQNGILTLTAVSKLNMQHIQLPAVPISPRCTHPFPGRPEQQAQAGDPSSRMFRCGYNPLGLGGYSAEGNLNPNTGQPFTFCGRTKDDCVARGMYALGRPNMVTWAPAAVWKGKSFVSGNTDRGVNSINPEKWNSFCPNVFYQGWVKGICLDTTGGPDSVRSQVIVNEGDIGRDGILRVVVDGAQLGHNPEDNIFNAPPPSTDPSYNYSITRWQGINTGGRNGTPINDAPYNGVTSGTIDGVPFKTNVSDPLGSFACIEVVVPREWHGDSSSPLNVEVLVGGPAIRAYTGTNTYDMVVTDNASWQLMNLLVRGPFYYSELDILRFMEVGAKSNIPVAYKDLTTGILQPAHPSYSCALNLQERTSLADIVNGVLNANNLLLTISPDTGLVGPFLKQTLAEQQPDPVPGSNDNTAYPSLVNGWNGTENTVADASGYVAYHIDESSILRVPESTPGAGPGPMMVRFFQRGILETPNIINQTIQNQDRLYSIDTFYDADTDSLSRNGDWEVSYTSQLAGIQNFDQLHRIGNIRRAEAYRGNPRDQADYGDVGGTFTYELHGSVRWAHLQVGQIVSFSFLRHDIDKQLFRITSVRPTTNYNEIIITITWHDDRWYLFSYGQGPDPNRAEQPGHYKALPHSLYPCGGYLAPDTDSLFPGKWELDAVVWYSLNTDGSANVNINLSSQLPVNRASQAVQSPLLPQQGVPGPGKIPPGGYYIAICSLDLPYLDGDGIPNLFQLSFPQGIGRESYTVLHSEGEITLYNLFWLGHDGIRPANGAIFMGTDPNRLYFQGLVYGADVDARNSIMPTTVVINKWVYHTSLQYDICLPDPQFFGVKIKTRTIDMLGNTMFQIEYLADGQIRLPLNAELTDSQFIGYDVMCIGKTGINSSKPIPGNTFSIWGNNSAYLFVTGNPIDYGWQVGDWACILFKAASVTDDGQGNHVLADPNMGNAFGVAGQSYDIVNITNVHSNAPGADPLLDPDVTITVAEAIDLEPGMPVRIRDTPGNLLFGNYTVGKIVSPTSFTLDGVKGSGDYDTSTIPAGHLFYNGGITPGSMDGKTCYIFAGTGTGQSLSIISSKDDYIVVAGKFKIPPDDTSRYLIVSAEWHTGFASGPITSQDPLQRHTFTGSTKNIPGSVVQVGLFMVDSAGKESLESSTPFRFIYTEGNQGLTPFASAQFIVHDGTAGTDVGGNAYTLSEAGTPYDITISVTVAPISDVTFNITNSDPDGTGDTALFVHDVVIPIGTLGTNVVTSSDFPFPNRYMRVKSNLKLNITSGDTACEFTAILRWRIRNENNLS